MINQAYLTKDHSVFPPTWNRLDPDPVKGAKGLIDELGEHGVFMVIMSDTGPVACSGVLPFRGDNWINEAFQKSDAELHNAVNSTSTNDVPDWETCCFCVAVSERGRGLARRLLQELEVLVRQKGGERLLSNYAVDETGDFWPRLGFAVVPGAGGMLPKGFQTDPEKEGLRADVHFQMGAKLMLES